MPSRDIRLELIFEIEKALRNLKRAEKGLVDFEKQTGKTGDNAGKVFAGLKSGIAGFLGALAIGQVTQFTNEAVNLSDQAKDLRRSLGNLAGKEGIDVNVLMRDMETATGGAVDEIKLMQQATRGKFLGVDLKNLPTLFEFARQRARDTGESVDHLVESIVVGIGRKSPLILDNLGLTMDQLREAAKQVAIENGTWKGSMDQATFSANIQAAAVQVAKQSLEENGKVLRTATSDYKKFQAEITNTKIRIGDLLSGLQAGAVGALSGLNKSFNALLDAFGAGGAARIREMADEFKGLEKQVGSQENRINSLLSVYDDLSGRSDLTKQEQEKLNNAIRDLGKAVPGAITQVNQYGEAISINRGAIEANIRSQKELLKLTQQDIFKDTKTSISEAINGIDDLNKKLAENGKELEKLRKLPADQAVQTIGSGFGAPSIITAGQQIQNLELINRNAAKQAQAFSGDIEQLSFALNNFVEIAKSTPQTLSKELQISEQNAAALIERFKKAQEAIPQPETPTPSGTGSNDGQKAANERLRREADIATTLRNLRFENTLLSTKTELEQQLLRLEQEQENEERALAERLGIEQAAILSRNELRIKLAEKNAEALTLLDANATAEREKIISKRSQESAIRLSELVSEQNIAAANSESEKKLVRLEAQFSREKSVLQKHITELTEIESRAVAAGDKALAAQVLAEKGKEHDALLALEKAYYDNRQGIIDDANKGAVDAASETVAQIAGIFERNLSEFGANLLVSNEDLNRQKEDFESLVSELIELSEIEELSSSEQSRKSDIITQLNEEYGQYLGNIDLEKAKTRELNGVLAKANEITSFASKAKAAWGDFFQSLLDEMKRFLASQAVKAFLGFLFNLSGGLGGKGIFNSVLGAVSGKRAQTGRRIRGSAEGELVTVGENNTEEVIVPLARFADFAFGNYSLGDGFNLKTNSPIGREIEERAAADAGGQPGRVPFSHISTGPARPFAGLGEGRVFRGLPTPQIFNLPRSEHTITREHQTTRIVEKAMPVNGEITVRTIAPEASQVADHYIEVNRSILRPDNRFADEFLETKSGEFDG